jgi:hypothetical protein
MNKDCLSNVELHFLRPLEREGLGEKTNEIARDIKVFCSIIFARKGDPCGWTFGASVRWG